MIDYSNYIPDPSTPWGAWVTIAYTVIIFRITIIVPPIIGLWKRFLPTIRNLLKMKNELQNIKNSIWWIFVEQIVSILFPISIWLYYRMFLFNSEYLTLEWNTSSIIIFVLGIGYWIYYYVKRDLEVRRNINYISNTKKGSIISFGIRKGIGGLKLTAAALRNIEDDSTYEENKKEGPESKPSLWDLTKLSLANLRLRSADKIMKGADKIGSDILESKVKTKNSLFLYYLILNAFLSIWPLILMRLIFIGSN